MSTAHVDDIRPSYERALAMLERWESTPMTEDEQMEQQQEILNVVSDKAAAEDFTEQCKNMGQAAFEIDSAFNRVKAGFDLIKPFLMLFPELKVFIERWDTFIDVSESYFCPMSSLNSFLAPGVRLGMGQMAGGFCGLQPNLHSSRQLNWKVRHSLPTPVVYRLTLAYSLRR